MDWTLAISRNRDALRSIVAALFALTGMVNGGMLTTLPRNIHLMALCILRPAESAVRRLIVIAARGLLLKPRPLRSFVILAHRPEDPDSAMPDGVGRTRAFALFDPLKSFDPRSRWDAEPVWESGFNLSKSVDLSSEAESDLLIDATHLGQRLHALRRALDTIPHQARRLIRLQMRRDAALKSGRPARLSPMRPGLPPGWRERRLHEIDDVLRECHCLAVDRLNAP